MLDWLFHIDSAEVQTTKARLYLFVAIDQIGKFAFTHLAQQANRVTASTFLKALIATALYGIYTVLMDNDIQFRFAPRYTGGPTA